MILATMTSTIKFFKKFKNFATDAVPVKPEENHASSKECHDDSFPSEIPEDDLKEASSKPKNNIFNIKEKLFSKTKQKKKKASPNGKLDKPNIEITNNKVNGNVFNIVNGTVQFGNSFTFNSPTSPNDKGTFNEGNVSNDGEKVDLKKTEDIKLLFGSQEDVEHIFLEHISQNMKKEWRQFFRNIGYSQGQIDTKEEDHAKRGIAEVRYQLLLDWSRNSDNGTLGELASLLWNYGEKELCVELARLYKEERT